MMLHLSLEDHQPYEEMLDLEIQLYKANKQSRGKNRLKKLL